MVGEGERKEWCRDLKKTNQPHNEEREDIRTRTNTAVGKSPDD